MTLIRNSINYKMNSTPFLGNSICFFELKACESRKNVCNSAAVIPRKCLSLRRIFRRINSC